MKRLLTLSILMGTLFPGVYSEETGWSYKQTTGQAFYLFGAADLTIDGEALEESMLLEHLLRMVYALVGHMQ